MPLEAGTRIGPYEVVAAIGAGGMGEVYRARDTKLDRDVAIKILPEAFAADAERVARFEREAKTLAALNHPHIAQIYGLEEGTPSPASTSSGQAAVRALVMELVEGPTLEEKLAAGSGLRASGVPLQRASGPGPKSEARSPKPDDARHQGLPVDEALSIARQIAEALEAAHEQGIVHRDLKPANIAFAKNDQVKVLDFGLAKLTEPGGAGGPGRSGGPGGDHLSQSPTLTLGATQAGVILGTAAYMSPEQARGKVVDKRADIWAFGCVLFEMLTGRRPFGGEEVSDTLAFILTKEPDWNALPAAASQTVRAVLRRCLEKDPKRRLRDIGDARLELEAPPPHPDSSTSPVAPGRAGWSRLRVAGIFAGVVVIAAATAAAILARRTVAKDTGALWLSVLPPEGTRFTPVSEDGGAFFALSPDGDRLAFVTDEPGKRPMLQIRTLSSLAVQTLAGTESALYPFWSPDGRSIGFFADGRLKRIDVTGGPPQVIAPAPNPYGGAWSVAGQIVFAPTAGPLFTVAAAGGTPTAVTSLDAERGHSSHRFPRFLPDGDHYLYAGLSNQAGQSGVYLGSLSTRESRPLIVPTSTFSTAVYASPGYLLFAHNDRLMAVAFDVARLQLAGEPFTAAPEAVDGPGPGHTLVSVGRTDRLAYVGRRRPKTQLTWFDRKGARLGEIGSAGDFRQPVLAPDGTRFAVEVLRSPQGRGSDVWLFDRDGSQPTRFTFGQGSVPVWSPDGTHVAYLSGSGIYIRNASGAEKETILVDLSAVMNAGTARNLTQWSSSGRAFFLDNLTANSGWDVWRLPTPENGKPEPLLHGPASEVGAQMSPDGRWIAYSSDESGAMEVFVQPFPGLGGKWQVSVKGGTLPRWRRDGKEIFYLAPSGMLMAAAVSVSSTFLAGAPQALFQTQIPSGIPFRQHYDVSADGQKFIVNNFIEDARPPAISVISNWTAALKP